MLICSGTHDWISRVCCVCLFVWAVSHSSLAVCNAHAMYILSIRPQLLHKGERFNKQC